MNGFGERLDAALRAAPGGMTRRQLGTLCGLSVSAIHKIFQRGDDGQGPGFFSVVRMCEVLNVTPNYLAGLDGVKPVVAGPVSKDRLQSFADEMVALAANVADRPSLERMHYLYLRGGGRLEAFSAVMDYVDLFELPSKSGRCVVRKAGEKSLSTLTIGRNAPGELQRAIDSVTSQEFHDHLTRDYRHAEEHGWCSSPFMEMDILAGSISKRIKADYSRLLLRVEDAQGERLILNYAKLIQ